MVEIANQLFPEAPRSLADVRRRDQLWDGNRFELVRVVAEDADGTVVGWGQLNHLPHQFDPHSYRIGIQVDLALQRQGIGTQIHGHLIQELRDRGATIVSARARGDLTASVAFLEHRGYVPVEETWESTMRVDTFDPERSRAAEARLARQGITITSLAAEGSRDRAVLEQVYALYLACLHDVPTANPVSDVSFEQFIAREVEAPNALPEAHFLAVADGAYVAMCNFVRDPGQPTALAGRMTGSLPAWRGRGIVTTLKLRMARFAVEAGFETIRTWNSATNASMLRINESMGFVKQSSWVTFHKSLDAHSEGTRV
jgi:GNAT superfamily N-acetyltransferase